jgi:hypothetical protein
VSIVTDRRCDGCNTIVEKPDEDWWALIPPGCDGEDHRYDFCDLKCLKAWVKKERKFWG